MKVARVVPCLDVTDGRVVKGTNFVDLRDAGDPVELAARYDAEGADELVFLDITASSDARETTIDMVYRVAEQVFIPFTVGGGIRSLEDARRMLRAGADKVSVNTAAVQRPELITEIADRVRVAVRRVRDRRQATRTVGGRRPMRLRGVPARRSHPDRHRRRRPGRPRRPSAARARSCSRRWIATARARASTSSSPGRQRRGRRAGDRQRRGRHARSTSSTASCSAAPTPCSPPRSSTSASTRSPRPRP